MEEDVEKSLTNKASTLTALEKYLNVLKINLPGKEFKQNKRKILDEYNKYEAVSSQSTGCEGISSKLIDNLTNELSKNPKKKWECTLQQLIELFRRNEQEHGHLTNTNDAIDSATTAAKNVSLSPTPYVSPYINQPGGSKRKYTTEESRDKEECSQIQQDAQTTPIAIQKKNVTTSFVPKKKVKVHHVKLVNIINSQGVEESIPLQEASKEMEVLNPGTFTHLWLRKEDVCEDIEDDDDVFVKPMGGRTLDKILKAMLKKTNYSGNLESFLRTGAFVEEIRSWHSDYPLRVTSAQGNPVHTRKSKDGDFLQYGSRTIHKRPNDLHWESCKCKVKMCCGSARCHIGLCPKHSEESGNVINGGVALLRDTSNSEEDVFLVAYGLNFKDAGEVWTENCFDKNRGFAAYLEYHQERTSKGLDSTWKKILFQAWKSPTELNHIRDNLTMALARFVMFSNLLSNQPKKRTLLKAAFSILSYKPETYVEILKRLNVTFEKSRDPDAFPVTEKSFAKINKEPLIQFPRVYNGFRRPGELYIGSKKATGWRQPKMLHHCSCEQFGLLMKNTRDGVVPNSHAIAQLDLTGMEVILMSEASKKEQTLWSEEMQDLFKRSCEFAEDLETWIIFSVLELQAIGEKIDEYPIRCLNSQITKVNLTSFRIEDLKTVNTITRYWTGSSLKYTAKPLDIENFPDLSDIFL